MRQQQWHCNRADSYKVLLCYGGPIQLKMHLPPPPHFWLSHVQELSDIRRTNKVLPPPKQISSQSWYHLGQGHQPSRLQRAPLPGVPFLEAPHPPLRAAVPLPAAPDQPPGQAITGLRHPGALSQPAKVAAEDIPTSTIPLLMHS